MLIYWDGPNFGDRLNEMLLRPQLELRGANFESPIVGLGTILDNRRLVGEPGIVCGAGVGNAPLPSNLDAWHMALVRGPVTAAVVGSKCPQGDPGFLLEAVDAAPSGAIFVPHMHTVARFGSKALEKASGLRVIDPRRPVDEVHAAIAGATSVAAEAMHAAIAAEACRVPWAPVRWNRHENPTKWMDALAPIGRAYDPEGIADRPQDPGGRPRKQVKRLPRLDDLPYGLGPDGALTKVRKAVHKGLDDAAAVTTRA